MDLFDGVTEAGADVKKDTDFVRGQRQAPLPSGIVDFLIKHAYAKPATSEALGIFLTLTDPDGREVKVTEYVTSGKTKGKKTYYEKENGDGVMEKFNLPGFAQIEGLCQIVAGKGIKAVAAAAEKKTINLYDFDAKGEKPTEVNMLVELVGKPVRGAVMHQIEDKTKKNTVTGNYEPTGETRELNVVDKFLDPQNRKTAIEIAEGVDAAYADKFEAKWNGQINDISSATKTAGKAGAPAATGDAAKKEDLFA